MSDASIFDPGVLLGVAAVCGLAGLGALLLRSRRQFRELQRARSELGLTESRLAAALDAIPQAFSLWDRNERLVLHNKAYLDYFPQLAKRADLIGMDFEELVRFNVNEGAFGGVARGAEIEAWIAERVGNFRIPRGALDVPLANGRWLQMQVYRTETGEAIGLTVDITAAKHAEEKLKESEARSRAVIDALDEALVVRDADFVFLTCNPAAERLFGMGQDSIVGKKSIDVFRFVREDGSLMQRNEAPMWRALHEQSTQRDVLYGLDRGDGTPVWVLANAHPVFDPQTHAVMGVVGTYRDVTALRKAEAMLRQSEEDNRRMLLALRQSADAIYSKDLAGTVTSWNAGAEFMYGYTEAEAVGRPLYDLLLPGSGEARRKLLLDRSGSSVSAKFEAEHRTKAGHTISVSVVNAPLYDADGRLVGTLTTSRDISELRRMQSEVERINRELERRVEMRTIELKGAVSGLESFAYSVAHDLRSPLRAIDGFSQILADTKAGALDSDGLSYLTRIRSQVKRMAQLIDDLLELSRVSRSELRMERVAVSEMATAILEELRREDAQRRVEWTVSPGLYAQGDPGLMRILLENLIGNAWKFTGKTEDARIEIGATYPGPGRTLYVRDNGAGFDMRYADKLFGPFQRLHSDKEFPGTGIGLATVRRILERHGARCWVEGRPGEGATVFFNLSDPMTDARVNPASLAQ